MSGQIPYGHTANALCMWDDGDGRLRQVLVAVHRKGPREVAEAAAGRLPGFVEVQGVFPVLNRSQWREIVGR